MTLEGVKRGADKYIFAETIACAAVEQGPGSGLATGSHTGSEAVLGSGSEAGSVSGFRVGLVEGSEAVLVTGSEGGMGAASGAERSVASVPGLMAGLEWESKGPSLYTINSPQMCM